MERPSVYTYAEPTDFLRDIIAYRKRTEPAFSVLQACKGIRRLSPTLVSLILKGERRICLDRCEAISKLCNLNAKERHYFKAWIGRTSGELTERTIGGEKAGRSGTRRNVSSFLLKDWVNVYAKDAVRLKRVQDDPQEIFRELGGIASPTRIEKALRFLIQEGYLRRNQEGNLVEDATLMVTPDGPVDHLIRRFHKQCLSIARSSIDQYGTDERYANALILPLNKQSYPELVELIKEFSEQLKDFAQKHRDDDERLYQVILNISPTGGGHE